MFEGNQQPGGLQDSYRKLEAAQYARSVVMGGAYDPDATKVNRVAHGVGADVKRTFEKMCVDHNAYTEDYMAKYVRPQKAVETSPISQKAIVAPYAKHAYKPGEIDQSTVDVFSGYNLDTRTMTPDQEKLLRNHELLRDDERKLPIYQLTALLKVKMLDFAAALKDKEGPRPVHMGYPNPASYNVFPNETFPQRMARQAATAPAVSPYTQYKAPLTSAAQIQPQQPAPQPEKKGFFSKVGSSIASAASKLKFW